MDAKYFPHGSPKHTCIHTHTCAACWRVETPACGARAACHCLSSVMDVPFVAYTHKQTDRQTDSGGAQLDRPVHPSRGWVPPLFRKEDVISLVKNPTYVACHSWLNPGFSFVQRALPFPSSPLTFSVASPSSSYLSIYLSIYLWKQRVMHV